jgi:N-acetylneuraminate synthase/pseudaminic acid synthase
MNLMTIKDMVERFGPQGVKIGLSDHSMQIEPVVTAVALGACVIEKHFTLDRSLGGEDAGFSLNAEEFAAMVRAVRNTEAVLGKVDYSVNQVNRKFGRSLYAVKDIKNGEMFTVENVRSIRPSGGLHPCMIDCVVGNTAACDIPVGTPLEMVMVK